jgi:excisionase family DNA binding protein
MVPVSRHAGVYVPVAGRDTDIVGVGWAIVGAVLLGRLSRSCAARQPRRSAVDDHLSTEQLGWVLGVSPATIRDQIRSGDIQGARIPRGFRIPKDEVLRLARAKAEADAGRTLSDRALERLIDEVIATNEAATE